MSSMTIPIIVLVSFLVLYLVLKFVFKINLFAFLNGGIMDLFKIAGIAGAIIEVLSLSDLAMSRNIPAVTAYGRYSMLALVETLLGFWFISSMTESFYEKLKDGYITVYEVIKTLLGSCWIFYLSYFITGNIWITYLESLGRVELQQAYISLANSMSGIHIETNEAQFDFDKGEPVTIEYGAWFTIYVSVLFNFLAMPYLLRKHWKEFRLLDPKGELGRRLYSNRWYKGTDMYISPETIAKQEKEFKDKNKKENKTNGDSNVNTKSKYFSEKSNKGDALMDYLSFLKSMFNIDESEFKNYAFEHCGRNFDTNTPIKTSITNSKVTDGSMSPEQALSKLTEDLVSKSSYGLKELYAKSKDLSDEIEIVIKMKDSLVKLEEEIDKTTDPATRATRTNDWLVEHGKYKSFVGKVEGLYNKYKGASSAFINSLKTRNYKGAYDINKNVFQADYEMVKSYVQNIK